MFPQLTAEQQDRVVQAVLTFLAETEAKEDKFFFAAS
jgi:hypothetical protein